MKLGALKWDWKAVLCGTGLVAAFVTMAVESVPAAARGRNARNRPAVRIQRRPQPAPAARKQGGHKPGLVREALQHRGTPYVWGGASRGGFDCSGFTRYLYLKQRGISLPHSASAQARYGKPVHTGKLRGGDLLFFSTYRRGICHVGMYLGNGRFIHAANSRKDVRIDTLKGYYARRLKAARRLVGAG